MDVVVTGDAVDRSCPLVGVRDWNLPSIQDLWVQAGGKVTTAFITESTIDAAYAVASPIGTLHPGYRSAPAAPVADSEAHFRRSCIPARRDRVIATPSMAMRNCHRIPIGIGAQQLKRNPCLVDERRGA
jgi:hypothetical protein